MFTKFPASSARCRTQAKDWTSVLRRKCRRCRSCYERRVVFSHFPAHHPSKTKSNNAWFYCAPCIVVQFRVNPARPRSVRSLHSKLRRPPTRLFRVRMRARGWLCLCEAAFSLCPFPSSYFSLGFRAKKNHGVFVRACAAATACREFGTPPRPLGGARELLTEKNAP